ncbi:MAG: hypothetical protein U0791_23405 [Gemmataceae bacterium]
MIRWKAHGFADPVYTSECGQFTLMRSPRREWIAKRYDFPEDRTPAETSAPLGTLEAAKQWCEARRLDPVLSI